MHLRGRERASEWVTSIFCLAEDVSADPKKEVKEEH